MKPAHLAVAAAAMAALVTAVAGETSNRAEERARMVEQIRREARLTGDWIGGLLSERVLGVMAEIPRHEFVPTARRDEAYENRPLPIGHGQTISQPYIVALMTHLIEPQPDDVVLDVGTGSAYQAAVLARLVERVYSIEILPELAEPATERLRRLGLTNVETRVGDGHFGWQEHAPYDGIIVAAAAGHVPPALVAQLKPGGRMAIPVGGPFATQYLLLVEKLADGEVRSRQILPVRFVPLVGEP